MAAAPRIPPLDVVVIHPNANARLGGIPNACLSYLEGLRARGHGVTLWTGSPALARRAEQAGFPVLCDNGFRAPLGYLASAVARGAVREAKRRGVDAYLHNTARLWPWVWTVLPWRRQFVVFHFERVRARGLFPHLLTIAPGQGTMLRAARRWRPWIRAIAPIRNGCAIPAAPMVPSEPREPVVIGSLDDGGARKGIDLIVAAAGILRERGADFRIVIGGENAELLRLRDEVGRSDLASVFTWSGWIDDIDAFYAAIDIYCLASRAEGFPLVLLEAMTRGRAVVSTASDGPAALLKGRPDLGWLVPSDDQIALAGALEAAIADPARRKAVATEGRRHVRAEYGPDAVGLALERAILAARVRAP